jgi:hypothetical protein
MDERSFDPEVGLIEECGLVVGVVESRNGANELLVALPGRITPEKAIMYPSLTCQPVVSGDKVLLNTTAVNLELGTGGYHFVISKLDSHQEHLPLGAGAGHIMKLRYTPMQVSCLAVEEQRSPFHEAMQQADNIAGMPVVVAGLHSQLAPIAVAIHAETRGKARIVYIMNDTACLALGFSRLVDELQNKQLIDMTITSGQAFGGDMEAINIYSALLAAKTAAGADVAIVAQGPGNVGTDTLYGFGAIYQGEAVNAVGVLGGLPVAAARMSFADPRPRHRGISQQFLVSLGRVALCRALVPLPELEQAKLSLLHEQLGEASVNVRHEILIEDGEPGLEELARLGISASSMGRGVEEDREFFLAASAAGRTAAKRLNEQAK